ncbi:MAG TPA: heavy metal-associated domain-containing protein [Gemmatales bacterium]|nr:heavy metal-associated domain-containing protein [Gemmatales bacterium]
MITTFSIPGIHCASCAALIKDVSSEFPSIKSASVNIESKSVAIEHDETFDLQKWKEKIEAIDENYKIQAVS